MSGIFLGFGSRVGKATMPATVSSESFESGAKPAFGRVKVDTDGNVYGWEGDPLDSYVNQGAWLQHGSASDFEVRMTYVSGDYWETYPTGDDATQSGNWIPVTVDREWVSSVAAPGSMAGTFTLAVRDVASKQIQGSVTAAYNISSSF